VSVSVLSFFVLLVVFSVPFWLIGEATQIQLLPGLPVSALMAACPLCAAAVLTFCDGGTEAVKSLIGRAADFARVTNKLWFVPVLLLPPLTYFTAYELMLRVGAPLPKPHLSVVAGLALFLVFFVSAIGEEVGWSGYLIDRLQEERSAFEAAIVVGLAWAVWHMVPLAQVHRSGVWIAAWFLGTVAQRVIMVWLYNNAGKSVFATILFHAMSNVSWLMVPNFGSHYDPRYTAPILILIAAAVTVVWGPRTLTGAPMRLNSDTG
jgi:membrane protease YdiL (CAAX protease family)